MAASNLIFFLIICLSFKMYKSEENKQLKAVLEEKFLSKFSEYTHFVAKWLQDFNDKHLNKSEIGRIIHYEELKPEFGLGTARDGKSMKKMGMAMIPLIFHVGAASTWMLLTGILAAKSVAIGLALLVFKIAVSSAKLASFFTTLKASHGGHHEYSWTPHAEHHGFARSLTNIGPHHHDWTYSPQVNDISPSYKSIPLQHYEAIDDAEFTEHPSKSRS